MDLRIDFGTHGVKMTRYGDSTGSQRDPRMMLEHGRSNITTRVPVLDTCGDLVVRNMMYDAHYRESKSKDSDLICGNSLLHRFPQSATNIQRHCPTRIIYGITKHLYRPRINQKKATILTRMLVLFFKYLLDLVEGRPPFNLSIIVPTHWSPMGNKIFERVIQTLQKHHHVTLVPYQTAIRNTIILNSPVRHTPPSPAFMIDFGESLQCMYMSSVDDWPDRHDLHRPDWPDLHQQLHLGGNDFTKVVVQMVKHEILKHKSPYVSLETPKMLHKLWVFAEKLKCVLSANETIVDTFETPDADYTIALSRVKYQRNIQHLLAQYRGFVDGCLKMIPRQAACNYTVFIHGGVHRTPAVRELLQALVPESVPIKTCLMNDHALL